MRKTLIVSVVMALALWCTGAALAQTQNVQITNTPKADSVTGDSATVTWSTNVPAGSTVLYGTDRNKLDQKAEESWGGTNHKVQLKGLQPNTEYYFQVRSGQGLGTGSGLSSAITSFKT